VKKTEIEEPTGQKPYPMSHTTLLPKSAGKLQNIVRIFG
jgi:hypothetical protein